MITIKKFIQDGKKSKDMHLCSADVPNFWKGFYAIYEPNTKYNKSKFWLKRWHASNKGKVISSANMVINIEKGHSFWNRNVMNNINAKLN